MCGIRDVVWTGGMWLGMAAPMLCALLMAGWKTVLLASAVQMQSRAPNTGEMAREWVSGKPCLWM